MIVLGFVVNPCTRVTGEIKCVCLCCSDFDFIWTVFLTYPILKHLQAVSMFTKGRIITRVIILTWVKALKVLASVGTRLIVYSITLLAFDFNAVVLTVSWHGGQDVKPLFFTVERDYSGICYQESKFFLTHWDLKQNKTKH